MSVVFQLLPVLVFLFVVISVIRNVAKVLGKLSEQGPPRRAADLDPDQVARTRRIQAEIRLKIAERRGVAVPVETVPVPQPAAFEPPVMREAPAPLAPERDATQAAILERQERLAEQMRELEAARSLAQRKAAEAAAAARQDGERGAAAGLNRGVLADLREPGSLRRAFVLREVLGPPVGLR